MSSTKLIVRKILERSDAYDWSIQGLGMLRMYLNDKSQSNMLRLHVWDSRYKVVNVSPIHDHPWDFESVIVAGAVKQTRYMENAGGYSKQLFNFCTIKCGAGACTLSEKTEILLSPFYEEYREGQTYTQKKSEIHESFPEDGTVTLVSRSFGEKRDEARVFWRGDGEFVSAEPRPATPDEVVAITQNALTRWF